MKIKSIVKIIAWSTLAAVIVGGGYWYWQHMALYPSTNDAYVKANIVDMAPQVSGKVIKLYVKDNQDIAAGAPLFDIDPTEYELAVNKAQANVDLTIQQVKVKTDAVDAARAKVAQAQAQLEVDSKNAKRILTLVKRGEASPSHGDQVRGKLKISQATLAAANSELQEAIQDLGDPGADNAALRTAHATLGTAELNLARTHVIAPGAGKVANLTLRTGNTVTAGRALFSIIENDQWWVIANYKETELARIRPGQPAKVSLDIYPHQKFSGIVESISGGSGAAFALLPPENATGNWVKVTQRFPVKIMLTEADPNFPFRVGASSYVTIDTTK